MGQRTETHRSQCEYVEWSPDGAVRATFRPGGTDIVVENGTVRKVQGDLVIDLGYGTLQQFGIRPEPGKWYVMTIWIDDESPLMGVFDCIPDDEAIETTYSVQTKTLALP